MIFNRDLSLSLIATWVQGKYTEDMADLDADLFGEYRKLFSAVRDGLTLEQIGAGDYGVTISQLASYTTLSFEYRGNYGEALRQQLEHYAERLATASASDRDALIKKISCTHDALERGRIAEPTEKLSDIYFNELERSQSEKPILYGFKQLDRATDGMHRGQLIILGARPATGKTALALQWAGQALKQGHNVVFLSIEMPRIEIVQRLILQEQILDAHELKSPTEAQRQQILEFLDRIESEGFTLRDDVNALATIKRLIEQEKPSLLVIDQLTQLASTGKARDIRERYIDTTASLKRLAIEQDVAILALSQLNREADGRKRASIANLAESDAIGQNADVVLTLQNQDDDTSEVRGINLYVAKNRRGRAGDTIELKYYGSRYSFYATDYTQAKTRI